MCVLKQLIAIENEWNIEKIPRSKERGIDAVYKLLGVHTRLTNYQFRRRTPFGVF